MNTKYFKLEDNTENPHCSQENICINNRVIFGNPRITNFKNFDQRVLDEISRDKRGKINMENTSEDSMFDNHWIPVVTKLKRKMKPTFKILSNSRSQMSKECSN